MKHHYHLSSSVTRCTREDGTEMEWKSYLCPVLLPPALSSLLALSLVVLVALIIPVLVLVLILVLVNILLLCVLGPVLVLLLLVIAPTIGLIVAVVLVLTFVALTFVDPVPPCCPFLSRM